ncbi:MAG: chloride channel protein, partial [Leptospiraceae bacterium]|nr:chloride channel protein [Leptospiraceae bacterium]
MIFKPPISKETSSAVVEFLRIKLGLNKKLMLLFSSALLGVIVAAAAIAFTFILHAVKDGAAAIPFLEANAYLKPALGGLAVGIIVFLILRKPQGGGVEETIKMIKVDYKTTGLRHAIVRLLTSSITLGSGGSAGKEGPAVNIGGIVGSLLGRLLPFPESYVRTLIGAGAAAGIASAFQAPIAGAFFALEILLADFTLDTFSMIVVASVASTAVTQSFGDYSRHLKVPDYSFNDPIELLFYAAMGVAGGLIAVFFIRTLHASEEFFKRSPLPRFLKPALGGLLLGALAMIIPEIFGEGYQLINMTMAGKADELLGQYRLADYLGIAGILSVVMVAKIFGTAFTLGSGGSGGTIIPALFIGAIVGSIMAEITSYFFPELKISPGTWAMVGMGSVLAAMTQGPLFSITLFFEITR